MTFTEIKDVLLMDEINVGQDPVDALGILIGHADNVNFYQSLLLINESHLFLGSVSINLPEV